jgi:hypothetical protein
VIHEEKSGSIHFFNGANAGRGQSTVAASRTAGRDADKYAEMSRKVSQSWWAKLTPEERTKRAKQAAEGRWGKGKKKK